VIGKLLFDRGAFVIGRADPPDVRFGPFLYLTGDRDPLLGTVCGG
jgi:hypothetical protein